MVEKMVERVAMWAVPLADKTVALLVVTLPPSVKMVTQ